MHFNLANPVIKTLLGLVGGYAASWIDHALGNPTGGLAAYLGTHGDLAAVYVAGYALVHNYISAKYPPGVPKAP